MADFSFQSCARSLTIFAGVIIGAIVVPQGVNSARAQEDPSPINKDFVSRSVVAAETGAFDAQKPFVYPDTHGDSQTYQFRSLVLFDADSTYKGNSVAGDVSCLTFNDSDGKTDAICIMGWQSQRPQTKMPAREGAAALRTVMLNIQSSILAPTLNNATDPARGYLIVGTFGSGRLREIGGEKKECHSVHLWSQGEFPVQMPEGPAFDDTKGICFPEIPEPAVSPVIVGRKDLG